MNAKYNKGYQLPEELKSVMDLTDAVVDVMDDLFKYASHLIQTEMYEKNKKAPVKPIKQ